MNQIHLNDYKKTVFVNGMSEAELLAKVKEYEEIASGGSQKATIKLKYFTISKDWIYVDYEYAKDFEDWNFWHYQNFLLWLTDGKNDSFCLAYKEIHNYQDMLYAQYNMQDNTGASVLGQFKGAEYYYEVPGFYLEWLSDEHTCKLDADRLYGKRNIDSNVLEGMERFAWKETSMIVSD